MNWYNTIMSPHALNQRSPAEGKGKGQKLLAQGNALGIMIYKPTPCKGKSFKIMAQSLSKIYIHLIFHIKSTSPQIRENDLEWLHSYIGKLVKTAGCTEIKAGGIGDHVHVLFILSKDVTISEIVEEIKRNSSRWIKDLDPGYYHFSHGRVVMPHIPSVNPLWTKHCNILIIRKSITPSIRLQRNIEHSWNYIMWNIMKNSCSGIKEDWCCKGKSFVYCQVF